MCNYANMFVYCLFPVVATQLLFQLHHCYCQYQSSGVLTGQHGLQTEQLHNRITADAPHRVQIDAASHSETTPLYTLMNRKHLETRVPKALTVAYLRRSPRSFFGMLWAVWLQLGQVSGFWGRIESTCPSGLKRLKAPATRWLTASELLPIAPHSTEAQWSPCLSP